MKNLSIVSIILSAVAVVLAVVATVKTNGAATAPAAISEEQLAKSLKDNPQMIIDALQAQQEQEQAKREKAAQEALQKYAGEINSDANAPFIGPKDAKVIVVEFFDFSCGYCKRLAPAMEKVVAANSDVKFIFKPLSFVAPVSGYQAKAGMAANKQGKFYEFYKAVLGSEERMNEAAVDAVAAGLGLNMEQFKADIASDETSKNLNAIRELSQNIQVNGVPTVMINGKHISTMSADDLQNAINAAK